MKAWTRADSLKLCGGPCKRSIAKGEPMLVITFPGTTIALKRCVACAGPAPPDLPALTEPAPIQPTPMVRAGTVKLPFARPEIPADFKMAAAGRVPGEDDE